MNIRRILLSFIVMCAMLYGAGISIDNIFVSCGSETRFLAGVASGAIIVSGWMIFAFWPTN